MVAGGLILFQTAAGDIPAVSLSAASENLEFSPPDESEVPQTSEAIHVSVTGSVVHPGIYTFSQESRVAEALARAGGITPEADHAHVNQEINLAQKLKDEDKIYIPSQSEEVVGSLNSVEKAESTISNSPTQVSISINTATAAELDTLPGIGSSRATQIIENRPYAAIDELLIKKVLSTSLFGQLKNNLTI